MLRVLDLFSGIGGFSLGLERTGGFRTVAFCEIDKRCRSVLRHHWPEVPIFDDVRTLTGVECDVICGGFPCQDISVAGKRAGITGERSGLWSEYARLIGELRPRYVIVENVSALLIWGLGRVLGDLAALGYDAEWHCIPASAVGAPHRRDRIWIVAYPGREGVHERRLSDDAVEENSRPGGMVANGLQKGAFIEREALADPASADAWRNSEQSEGQEPAHREPTQLLPDASGGSRADQAWSDNQVAHAHQPRLQGRLGRILQERASERAAWESGASVPDADSQPEPRIEDQARGRFGRSAEARTAWWFAEPDVGRVANGVPSRMDRLKELGNAVVPDIPEIIGRAILEEEGLA